MPTPGIAVPELQINATEFLSSVASFDHIRRDGQVISTLLDGNVPSHMRSFVDVTTTFAAEDGTTHSITLYVLPDFLCLGTDDDYIRISMSPLAAQKLCNAWNCMLPTTKMSDIIWAAAANKLQPLPWGPPYDASMMSANRLIIHNGRIEKQLQQLGADRTKLTAGHKKDVVVTNELQKKRKQVAIYGWHKLDGKPIQPLYLGHENTYADYSHGIRLVSLDCELDGSPTFIGDILSDKNLASALSNEGTLSELAQPSELKCKKMQKKCTSIKEHDTVYSWWLKGHQPTMALSSNGLGR